jgi:membrane protein
MIENAGKEKDRGMLATVFGLAALLFGASAVFGQLKDALNTIWEVEPKPGGGIRRFVVQRFLSFTMVLGVGFLLLASLIISAGLAAFGRFLSGRLPGGDEVWYVLNGLIAFAVITAVFALLFKYLPDRRIPWRHVWLGAAFTAFLFTIGKFAIGFYLGRSAVASTYGAAGSVVVLLLWIYYSGLIFFFGAEFTEVHARRSDEKSMNRSRSRAPIIEVTPSPPMLPEYAGGAVARPERRHRGSGGATVATGVAALAAGAIVGSLATVVSAIKHLRKLLSH